MAKNNDNNTVQLDRNRRNNATDKSKVKVIGSSIDEQSKESDYDVISRKDIGPRLNRENQMNHNHNYTGLFRVVNDFVGTMSDEAFEKVVDSAKLNWREPVDSFGELPSDDSEGITRMVRKTGKVYRFNGSEWKEIQDIDPSAINELEDRLKDRISDRVDRLDEGITYGIPSDFKDLETAINDVSQKMQSNDVRVNLNIEKGHKLTSNDKVFVRHIDLSHVYITSDDNVVEAGSGFTGDFIYARNSSHAPVLDCLVDLKKLGHDGYSLDESSFGYVTGESGVINAGNLGLFVNRKSNCYARRSNFSGSDRGFMVDHAGLLDARESDFSNTGQNRVQSGSSADIEQSNISGAERIFCNYSSNLNIRGSDLTYIKEGVVTHHGSSTNMFNCDVSNSPQSGVVASSGSWVNARSLKASNCGESGVISTSGSYVNLHNAELSKNGSHGVVCQEGGTASVSRIEAVNNGEKDLAVFDGSFIVGGRNFEKTTSGENGISIKDVNVPFFNKFTKEGFILGKTRTREGALYRSSTAQKIPNDTLTAVKWNEKDYDTLGVFDKNDNEKIKVPDNIQSVKLSANLRFPNTKDSGQIYVEINRNGKSSSEAILSSNFPEGEWSVETLNVSTPVLDVYEGDYFEVKVDQKSGGDRNLFEYENWFCLEVVD